MAKGDPYVTSAAFKASVSIDAAETFADADITVALAAATGALDELTQRQFWKDAADVTRRFTANSPARVIIDDLVSVTTVVSDGTTVTDYLAEPLNAEADDKPWTRLVADTSVFSTKRGAVEITGVFGWPGVPPQVQQMTTILAGKLLKRTREAPHGVITLGGLDGQAIRLAKEDPDLYLLIQSFKRFSPVVA